MIFLLAELPPTTHAFWDINIGHVIVACLTLFCWGMTWQKSKDRGEANATRISAVEVRLTAVEVRSGSIAQMAADISAIKKDVDSILQFFPRQGPIAHPHE